MTFPIHSLVDHLFRRQSAQIVSTLTRALGGRHLDLAEEAVQDALVMALQHWPYRGVPDDPAAWLFRVARNRALDRFRHKKMVGDKEKLVVERFAQKQPTAPAEAMLAAEGVPLSDDQLGMMFLTCHPALPRESRVALTLKIVGGFSVSEIARAFLAPETAIQQRLVRAKRMLRTHDVPFETPDTVEIVARLDSVLEAIYLMFNEGYAATAGDALIKEEIATEAIRLTGLATDNPATGVPRAWALRALLLLHASRFAARASSDGELFLLRDQDRSKWDRVLMGEGLRALDRAAAGTELSRYHLEAEIAACHAVAPNWAQTDWHRIVDCYEELARLTGSPIVGLNCAIARAQVVGPRAPIAEIERIASHPALAAYHLLPAVLAELWRDAGDAERAAAYYRAALALAQAAPERRFLGARLAALAD
jgi:RNA polymerase sigma-70 factor (ECF subfamily)